eukprot:5680563-Pyramimonas_sp.AAC.1
MAPYSLIPRLKRPRSFATAIALLRCSGATMRQGPVPRATSTLRKMLSLGQDAQMAAGYGS